MSLRLCAVEPGRRPGMSNANPSVFSTRQPKARPYRFYTLLLPNKIHEAARVRHDGNQRAWTTNDMHPWRPNCASRAARAHPPSILEIPRSDFNAELAALSTKLAAILNRFTNSVPYPQPTTYISGSFPTWIPRWTSSAEHSACVNVYPGSRTFRLLADRRKFWDLTTIIWEPQVHLHWAHQVYYHRIGSSSFSGNSANRRKMDSCDSWLVTFLVFVGFRFLSLQFCSSANGLSRYYDMDGASLAPKRLVGIRTFLQGTHGYENADKRAWFSEDPSVVSEIKRSPPVLSAPMFWRQLSHPHGYYLGCQHPVYRS